MKKIQNTIAGLCLLVISLSSCKKDELTDNISPLIPGETERYSDNWGRSNTKFYALANGLQLDEFNSSKCTGQSSSADNSVTITGLQSGETILAIDFRPANGILYGLGSTSRLYVINPMTGVARMIGVGPFTPLLSGSIAGFDFNPVVDRIRVVTSTGQNLRINPETGTVAATDMAINGAAGAQISAVAYLNNRSGATSTVLYDIDPINDKLYRQDPPNNGTLVEIGPLTLDVQGEGGFDISPNEDGIAVFKINNVSTLLSIKLSTGEAKVRTTFPGRDYTAIAIPTASVAYAVDGANNLLIFGLMSYNNNNVISKPVTGLAAGDVLIGIDMRPLNGQLYGLGINSNVYTINTASGLATLAFTLIPTLSGTSFGMDFNPTVDRLRIVSNTGQNLRFNPNNGIVIVDLNLNPGTPNISAVAYTNNFAGSTMTELYGLDYTTNKFIEIDPPNAGTIVEIGNTNVNVPEANGFDIGGTSNDGYAVFKSGYSTKIYRINTTSGYAYPTGSIGNSTINGFAIGLGF